MRPRRHTPPVPSESSISPTPRAARAPEDLSDLLVLSHLRWDFVFQRPQHLMSRFAGERRVFFVEEARRGTWREHLVVQRRHRGLHVVVPHLPERIGRADAVTAQAALVDRLVGEHRLEDPILWYYTPMALPFTAHLQPATVVYDCMDELSLFKDAPQELVYLEAALFGIADVVFTGGQSLYEAKRALHPRIYPFPSSVDVAHFMTARAPAPEPADQASIPRPRIGFFGVLDERLDAELLAGLADRRPDWHLVMIGPVVKIDAATLPRRPNIHYLGPRAYADLPAYVAGWDVAMLPFARTDATRFISPTKTPEYLAAGRPVVSTPIRDVVRPYGERGLAWIAETAEAFADAIAEAMVQDPGPRQQRADAFLAQMSWDRTWARMRALMEAVHADRLGAVQRSATAAASLAVPSTARTGAV